MAERSGRARRQPRLEEFIGEAGTDGPLAAPAPRPPALPGIWAVRDGLIEHPLIAPGAVRALPFQIDLARIGLAEDLLVVLPTGLGKTVIAVLEAAEVLRRRSGRVLVLAPTRPLVQQHAEVFARWIPGIARAVFTGTVAHPAREGRFPDAELVFATPELVVHDLREERYDLRGVDLLVLDEAHHAVGKYAYVAIAERFRAERSPTARLLGLTASPGGKDERIEEVVGVLGAPRIEARGRDDEGVREYVQPIDIQTVWVDLSPTARKIQERLSDAYRAEGHALQKMGYLRKKPLRSLSVKDLVALRAEIFARPGPMTRKFGPLYHQLLLLHLHHALERLETQGIDPFVQYVIRVRDKEKPGRGDRGFVARPEVTEALAIAEAHRTGTRESSHPKIDALLGLVHAELGRPRDHPLRILVFAQFRDTIQGLVEAIESQGWTAGRFVGQATRTAEDPGMSQKEQAEVLAEFRAGRFPILVASSVAEEGLDVPDVDLVVFFESVPSEIRAIQRRGRTGRSSLGRVVLLLTRETRDVSHQVAEVRREKAMGRIVRRLSRAARQRRAAEGVPPVEGASAAEAPPPTGSLPPGP